MTLFLKACPDIQLHSKIYHPRMKPNKIFPFLLLILLASLLSACTGAPAASSWPGVAVNSDRVYLANISHVYGINPDGTMVWRYPEKANASQLFYARPVVSNGQVIVGDYKNTLYGLDAASGAERWKFAEAKDRFIGAVLVAGGKILAPSADNFLYALNESGILQWKFEAKDALWAQPVSDDESVFVGSMDHHVYSLDLASGRLKWDADLGAAIVYSLTLSSDNSTIYAGTVGSELVALDAGSGRELWRAKTNGIIWGRPVMDNGSLYLGDQTGKVYGFSAKDGAKLWEIEAGSPVIATGVLAGTELVFTTENGSVMAVDTTGKKLWNQTVSGKLYSSPEFTGDRLYVPVTGGEQALVALNPNGTQIWGFAPPK